MGFFLPLIFYGTAVALLITYGVFVYSRRNMYKYTKSMPGAPHLPFIGSLHLFSGNTTDLMHKVQQILSLCVENDVLKLWIGHKLFIVLCHPPSIEIVLNAELEKDSVYRFMRPWIGNGLLCGPFSIWKRHRKIINPTFNPKLLNDYVKIFAEQSKILVDKLSVEIGKGQFNVFNYMTLCTMDMICETAMGVKVHAQENKTHPYFTAGREEMSLIYKRMFRIWLYPQWIFNMTPYAKEERKNVKIVHDFTKAVIEEKRVGFENKKSHNKYPNGKSKIKSFLDRMIELNDNDKFTDEELREEVDTLTITGNDTSALAGSSVLMVLGCLPHIQDKVVDELREIFGDSKRPVEREDLSKMQYLERVIKETLRLFPVIPLLARSIRKDIKLEKYTLPAGSGCVVPVLGIHKNKKLWGDNADEFDPDRFLAENSVNRHPYAYIPFSGGMRDCIGKQYAMMAVKVFTSTVLRSYKLHSNSDYKNIELIIEVVMRSKNGYFISIEPRQL